MVYTRRQGAAAEGRCELHASVPAGRSPAHVATACRQREENGARSSGERSIHAPRDQRRAYDVVLMYKEQIELAAVLLHVMVATGVRVVSVTMLAGKVMRSCVSGACVGP